MDDFDFTPVYREEQFIDAILDEKTPPEPVFRREFYLAKIAGADVEVPEPVFRDDMYLAKAAGEDVDVPEPATREEMYLAKIAGEEVDTPDPVFRDEYWLNEWAGGGGPESVEKTVSGSIVTVTDALAAPAVALSTAINPVQDLHGYANPWPAGGGKNLFKPIASPIEKNGVTIEMTADGEFWVHGTPTIQSSYIAFDLYTFTFTPALDKTVTLSISEKTVGVGLILGSGNGNLNLTLSDTATSKTGTYTQGIGEVRINVRYDVGTINKKYKIQLEISGSATAWTPYSNICPISGFTGANVYRTGVNVWDEEWEVGSYNTTTGAKATSSAGRLRCKNHISVVPGSSYYVSSVVDGVLFYDTTKTYANNYVTRPASGVVAIPNGVSFITFYTKTQYGSTYNNDISINYPATDTDYHAYSGTTYTVQFGTAGTVYGGTLDVTAGTLTVDRAIMTPNAVSLQSINSYGIANFGIPFSPRASNAQSDKAKAISNALPVQTIGIGSTTEPGFLIANETGGYVRLKSTDADTVPKANTWIADNGLKIVYILETPQTYTLTPTEVQMLLGTNNVWSDTGDTTLTYLADGRVNSLTALNMLLGNMYTPSADVSDRKALQIIMGETT